MSAVERHERLCGRNVTDLVFWGRWCLGQPFRACCGASGEGYRGRRGNCEEGRGAVLLELFIVTLTRDCGCSSGSGSWQDRATTLLPGR
jgi:hypothetical protein